MLLAKIICYYKLNEYSVRGCECCHTKDHNAKTICIHNNDLSIIAEYNGI